MENIPVVLLFVISLAACLAGTMIKNHYSKKLSDSIAGYHLYNALTAIVCSLTLLALSGGKLSVSPFTVFLAVIFGLVTVVQQVANSAALASGPLAYTSVIGSMSTVITAFSGLIFFSESISVTQIIGIFLMLFCLVLSVKKDTADEKKAAARWLILCFITCFATGGIGILQKLHQSSDYKDELTAFLIIAFAFSFVFSAANIAVIKLKSLKSGTGKVVFLKKKPSLPILIAFFAVAGIGVALNNMINLYLSGTVPSAIFFPIVNGGGLILTTLASVFFFRERLTKLQWVGIALGFVATLLLCL